MVAHIVHDVGNTQLMVGNDPQRHILGIGVDAQRPRQVTVHTLNMVIEEAPYTSITDATAREIGEGISHLPREVFILTVVPAHLLGILDGILRAHHIVLVLRIETSDTALVGMTANCVIGNSQSHPYHTFLRLLTVRTATLHLHNPSLVGVANSNGLTFTVVAVGLDERCHRYDGFTRRL